MNPLRLLLAFCLILTTATASEYRTFTNKQGDEIRARLIRVDGDKVEIEREDGQIFKIDLNLLSEEDVTFARNFATAQIIAKDPRFQVTARRSRFNKTRRNNHPDWRGGLNIKLEEEELIYILTINNGSSQPVTNFRISYQLVYQLNDHGLKTTQGIARLKGDVEIPYLGARSEVTVETKPIRYFASVDRETVRERNGRTEFIWIKSQDLIRGLLTRIEVGDEVIREESYPGSLIGDFGW